MATNYPAQPYAIPEYMSQEPSPASSASPTSPRMQEYLQQHAPNPYKQLRPLKSPLYVPAALRPTEHFCTSSPMTPPKSLQGSLDNLQEDHARTASPEAHHDMAFNAFDPDWAYEEDLGEVTGPPSRDHWKVRQETNRSVEFETHNLKFAARVACIKTCRRMLTYLFYSSPTKLHRPATRHNVDRPSVSLSANTIVAIVGIFSVRPTLLSQYPLTSTPSSTLMALRHEHATYAIVNSSAGTQPGQSAARTAKQQGR